MKKLGIYFAVFLSFALPVAIWGTILGIIIHFVRKLW